MESSASKGKKRRQTEPETETETERSGSTALKNTKGWKLLKLAGWEEGKGVGRLEDGIKSPVRPFLLNQRARKGLGTVDTTSLSATKAKTKPAVEDRQERERSRKEKEEQKEEEEERKKKTTERAGLEKARHKAISRYIYSSFKDTEGSEHGPRSETHPLLGGNRLSALNPLLDDDDF